jgi:predicted PurR-regulated permease PerM
MDESPSSVAVDAPTVAPESVRGLAATVVFGAGVLYVLREAGAFWTPILLAVLLAYALEPLVGVLARCRLPRPAAVVVTLLLVVLTIVGCARLVKRQATAFVNELPETVAAIKASALRHDRGAGATGPGGTIHNLQRAATNLQATVDAVAPPERNGARRVAVAEPFDVRAYILSAWGSLVETGAQLLVTAVLTFVLLLGGDAMKKKLVDIAGPRFDRQIVTIDVIRLIDRQIQRYLVARLAISLIVCGLTAAAMWWLGLRQPLVLGAIAGALNILPFIGPTIGVVICAVAAFIQLHSVETTLIAGGAAGLVAALEGNLITPWLTSRAGELNTVAVFVSVLFWGWMWGVWGLLLAVPIMIAVKAAADHLEPLQAFGELLGR